MAVSTAKKARAHALTIALATMNLLVCFFPFLSVFHSLLARRHINRKDLHQLSHARRADGGLSIRKTRSPAPRSTAFSQ